MLILLIVVLILSIIINFIADDNGNDWLYIISIASSLVSALGLCFVSIAVISFKASLLTVNDKINMYEEENKNIETQITEIVNNYQGYEKEIISNVADMETILIKIPELKSSELVKKQMEVYIANNDEIKELKEEKIDTRIYKWLLYFG